jgi:hypothetical protein
VNDRFLIELIQGGHDAIHLFVSTRVWCSTERWRSAVRFTSASVVLSLLRLIQKSKIRRPLVDSAIGPSFGLAANRRDRWPADIRPLSPRRIQPPRSKADLSSCRF